MFNDKETNVWQEIDMMNFWVVWWFKYQSKDGSVLGNPGPAGIGGVLRDCDGKVLCMFSCYVRIHDSNSAELIAIHKACALCVISPSFVNIIIGIRIGGKMVFSPRDSNQFTDRLAKSVGI
ncbi:hypothetical protein Ddye_030432 [Dipteronia dyeriana]|uniref:RNase H type-1 domain-containing protein n=1 Tax=Dipteronia dyeriana TaxID=168575 RepID=A0AAD9WMN7_9ROSI|nr:hypothetical protein Ddye_030432 [Dipteronia dyeriana]